MARSNQLQSLARDISLRVAISALAIVFVLMVVATQTAQAQTLTVLHNFTGGADGAESWVGLTMDKAGNLYGTTRQGGGSGCAGYGCGTVFKLSKKGSGWVFTPLYSFQGGNDGSDPFGRVTVGPDGSVYGATDQGGGNGCLEGSGCGTIFNLRPPPRACSTALCPWTETVLYRFAGGSDGAGPHGDLIFDQAGNLYGGAGSGGIAGCYGYGCGLVFKLIPSNGSWTETVLYSFTGGNDGGNPNGGVIFDQNGNLYGVAASGGSVGLGTVYELTPSGSGWVENTLFSFQTGAMKTPIGSLIFDQFGNLYGTTLNSRYDDGGAAYKLTESNNNWSLATWFSLGPEVPEAGLTMDGAGNLYGDALSYNGSDYGIVFKMDSNLQKGTVLHHFTGSDGDGPAGSVIFDASGNLYGTTISGGTYGWGVVWEITP